MFYLGFLTSSFAMAASAVALVLVIVALIRKQTQMPGAAVLLTKLGFFTHSTALLSPYWRKQMQSQSYFFVRRHLLSSYIPRLLLGNCYLPQP